jgi:hypothetical protein
MNTAKTPPAETPNRFPELLPPAVLVLAALAWPATVFVAAEELIPNAVVGATEVLLCATALVLAGTVGELCFGFVVALRTVELTVVDIAVVIAPAPADAGDPGQVVAAATISSGTEAQTLW